MKGKLIIFVCLLPFLSFSQSDSTLIKLDEKSNLSIKGFVDTYYSYDFSEPFSNEKPPFFYNHTKHNELSVNLALVQLHYQEENVRGAIGLMAGTYAQYNLAHEQDLMKNIFEAYAGVQLYKDLWLDAGVFGSHLGFESAISTENITLTRSLVAENSPYYLSGAKLTYDGIEKWTFLAVVSNGWQNMSEPWFNENKALGYQIVFTPNEKLSFNYSNWYSDESTKAFPTPRFFNDVYAIITPTEKLKIITAFDIGFQNDVVNNKKSTWYAPAVLVGYDWHEKFSTGVRGEYYVDEDEVNVSVGNPNGFQTLGASINLDYKPSANASLRVEGKWLNSKDAMFLNSDNLLYRNNYAITTSLAIKFGN